MLSIPRLLERGMFFALILMAAFIAVVDCQAEEKTYPEQNFALTVPSSWEEVKDLPRAKATPTAFFRSPDKESIILVTANDSSMNQQPVGPIFVFAFEKGLQASGVSKPTTTRYFEIGGIKAYERTGVKTSKGKKYSTITQVVVAGGRMYIVQAMRPEESGGDDEEIRSILTSFRFLTQPKPADELAGKSAAYRTGFYVGRILMFIVFVVAAVWIIIAARKNSSRYKTPPLPPR